MKTSESIKEIAKAMTQAQAAMTGAKKTSDNPFFTSTYADLTSVMIAIKEAFAAHGLSFVQSPSYKDGLVGVTTRIMHVSGEWIQGIVLLPMPTHKVNGVHVPKIDPQAAGAAITYARRYALQSMAGVPSTDDDGETAMQRAKVNDLASAISANFDDIATIKDGLVASADNENGFNDLESAAEAWFSIPEETQRMLWVATTKGGPFTTLERKIIKTTEFKNAYFHEAQAQ